MPDETETGLANRNAEMASILPRRRGARITKTLYNYFSSSFHLPD